MLAPSPRLDLDEREQDFILRRTGVDGSVSEMLLSGEDVLSLAQSAQALRERVLSRQDPEGGTVRAVYVTPVTQVGLHLETLAERILLTLVDPLGSQLVFALPHDISEYLIENLPACLAEARAVTPTRQ